MGTSKKEEKQKIEELRIIKGRHRGKKRRASHVNKKRPNG